MNKPQQMYKMLQDIIWVSQLGLNLIMPLLLCLGGCWWLCTRMGVGLWLYIPGFLLGMASSWSSAWRFYRLTQKRAREGERSAAFNQHR